MGSGPCAPELIGVSKEPKGWLGPAKTRARAGEEGSAARVAARAGASREPSGAAREETRVCGGARPGEFGGHAAKHVSRPSAAAVHHRP